MLDTNIVSDLMRGASSVAAPRLVQALNETRVESVGVSVVVKGELLFGLHKKPADRLRAAYEREIAQLAVFALEDTVTEPYGAMRARLERQGVAIGANDALIAAHAMSLGAVLVSGDAVFQRIEGLDVENWLQSENQT